ncbi:hypothetical protein NCY98_05575, partial [Phocaeicola vulgatus]|nr:hypothetical protein [Phocaeicola vulgatus]
KEIPLAADQAETIHYLNPSFPLVCSPSHWLGPRMSLPSIATTPFTSRQTRFTQLRKINSK